MFDCMQVKKISLTSIIFMKPIVVFFALLFTVACKNNTSTTANSLQLSDSAKANPNWSNEGEGEFINNCVTGAKTRYNNDEKQAYKYCNCILNQIKQKYPNLDSASALLNDTAQMVKLQNNCK